MLTEKTSKKIYLVLLIVVLLLTAAVIIWASVSSMKVASAPPSPAAAPTPQVVIREKEVEKLVEVEKEITAEIIRDGLRDMGVLVTEEYYFTEVINYSSMKTLFGREVPMTESSYVASYDGVVTAGIDFSAVEIRKDDAAGRILVTLPAAEIMNVDIDPESFVLYSERIMPWNPISSEEYNSAFIALEEKAREHAMSRGLLEKADSNARTLVRNMIAGLVDTSRFTVEFTGS